jgi:hypothetical protein
MFQLVSINRRGCKSITAQYGEREMSKDMMVETGTYRSVYIVGGVRKVVKYAEPRDFHVVLDEYAAELERRRKPVKRAIDVSQVPNVLNDPLLRLSGTGGEGVGGIRLRKAVADEGTGRPSLGQYRDFRDKPRSLPQLNGCTIRGILLQPRVLGCDDQPTEESLRLIAGAASKYRREQGLGGGDCCPESVELYVRIFRAIGMQPDDVVVRDADHLNALYIAYLQVHAS